MNDHIQDAEDTIVNRLTEFTECLEQSGADQRETLAVQADEMYDLLTQRRELAKRIRLVIEAGADRNWLNEFLGGARTMTFDDVLESAIANSRKANRDLVALERKLGLYAKFAEQPQHHLRRIQSLLQDLWSAADGADEGAAPNIWRRFNRIEERFERPLLARVRALRSEEESDELAAA